MRRKVSQSKAAGEIAIPSARDILRVLFRHKYLIAAVFLVISIAGFFVVMSMPDEFESEARLLLRPERSDMAIDVTAPGLVSSRPGQSMNAADNEISILRSRSLHELVAKDVGPDRILMLREGQTIESEFKKDPDPQAAGIKWAARYVGLGASFGTEGDIIVIRYRHAYPKVARDVVDSFVTRYMERHIEVHRSSLDPEILKREADDVLAKIRTKEAELAALSEENNLISIGEQREQLRLRKTQLETELAQRRVAIESSKAVIDVLKKSLQGRMSESKIPPTQMENPELTPYKQRLAELKVQQLELSQVYSGGNQLQAINDQIVELERTIKSLPATVQRPLIGGDAGAGADPAIRLAAEELTLQSDQAAEMQLQQQLDESISQLAALGDDSQALAIENELRKLREDHESAEDAYRDVARSARLDEEKISNVSVLQGANLPDLPVGPRRMRNLAMVLFVAAAAGIGLAVVREFLDDTLKTRDEVEKKLGIPVLAVVPAEEFRKCI